MWLIKSLHHKFVQYDFYVVKKMYYEIEKRVGKYEKSW